MDEKILKHFKEFYNRLVFLDTNVGNNEETFEREIYYYSSTENGKPVVTSEYAEETVDYMTYLRKNGLLLRIRHDGWCKKYKSLEISIQKDPYYEDKEKESIKAILEDLNIFLENNYKEFYERVRKVIHNQDPVKDIKIKYQKADLFSKDNVKTVSLRNTTITNEDIEALAKYPNLKTLIIEASTINATNFSLLKPTSIIIINSNLASLKCLNHISCYGMTLSNTIIENQTASPITLNVESLNFDHVQLNYELLFLCTDFKGLKNLKIQDVALNPIEVETLKVFYEVEELLVYGKCYSFDVLNNLKDLKQLSGYLELVSEENLRRLQEKYKRSLPKSAYLNDERLANSLYYREKDRIIDLSKFAKKIILPGPSLAYWTGKITSSNLEDVKKIVSLPAKIKRHFGEEKSSSFVETTYIDPFHILLSKTNGQLLSDIVGPNNQRLIKPSFGYIKEFYILDQDGKVLEKIETFREQDIKIAEYYQEYKKTYTSNDNNAFDYYYNRQVSEKEKLSYLKTRIKEYLEKKNIPEAREEFARNSLLIKDLERLSQEEVKIIYKYEPILWNSPIYRYEDQETTINGQKYFTTVRIPDDFSKEDTSLYQALYRTRNLNLISYSLEEIFKQDNITHEDQEETMKAIKKLLNIWQNIDDLNKRALPEDLIADKYVKLMFKEVVDQLERHHFQGWYLKDIKTFLETFAIDEDEKEMLTDYILMKQCRFREDLIEEREKCNQRYDVLVEAYSVESILYWYYETEKIENPDELLSKKLISEDEYRLIMEYFELKNRESEINNILDMDTKARYQCYQEMIPAIDNFTLEDLKALKSKIPKTDEGQDRFDKFTDYIYYYLHQEYPEWIETELRKYPYTNKKCENVNYRESVKEHSFHVKSYTRIYKG